MTKAYSYIRFSSKAQASGDSLRRQTVGAQEFAKKHGLELVETGYSDLGVSGYRGENASEGALGEFIKAIDAGKIEKGSYLIVESLDRLSREKPNLALTHFLGIINKGVNIATLTDGQIYRENSETIAMELFGSLMVMSRAHEESKTKAERIKQVWKNKRDEAQKSKKPYTAMCPAWIKKTYDKYELIEERARVIQEIFEMSEKGSGASSITRHLNNTETPTFGRSDFWHTSYIKKILNNKSTYGAMQPKKGVWNENNNKYIYEEDGDPIEEFYPAAITKEKFYSAKSKKLRPKTRGRSGERFSNLFKGIIKCGYCGSPVHYINKGSKPKGGTYLRCSMSRSGGKCDAISMPYLAAEESLLGLLSNLNYMELVPEQSNIQKKRASTQARIETLRGTLEEIEISLTRFTNIIASTDNPPSTILASITQKEGEREATLKSIDNEEESLLQIEDLQETALKANEVAVGIITEVLCYDAADTIEAKIKSKELREQLNFFFKKYISEIEMYDHLLTIHFHHNEDYESIDFHIIKHGQHRIWQGSSEGQLIGVSILRIKESIENILSGSPRDKESEEVYKRLISLGMIKDFSGSEIDD
ncbi:recombinase family protein [Vreelandella andesensis]|uniref:Recombinase family protein n=1 Tax=Vreelandella andesensis TaxID=447567 RepID=A0A433KKF8_9GAMM|nr:recombinase family protein [Halomonas andesensis]RUR30258.1 recombinase family protein [Halomonas andesensis]